MTGDGANDAAALKQAEVGIAVEKSVDLAELSASAVLLRPSLPPLVKMVEIGRAVQQRLHTYMLQKSAKIFQVRRVAERARAPPGRPIATRIARRAAARRRCCSP